MLECGEIFDITLIQQWHQNVIAQLDDLPSEVKIDVSKVQKIDTAGIQVLTSLVKYLDSNAKQVVWSEPSPAFINAVSTLGLKGTLHVAA